MTAGADVIYHGNRDHRKAGPAPIAIETPAGEVTGLLHNHGHGKSPDGFAWSYGGSGPAATAKSLLIDALGDRAKCPTCGGCQQIIWRLPSAVPPDVTTEAPIPFDTAIMDQCDPGSVSRCYDCDDGYRRLPYHDFTAAVVATWGDEFRISRREILTWLIDHHPGCLTASEG
jgi:hypothetical protein